MAQNLVLVVLVATSFVLVSATNDTNATIQLSSKCFPKKFLFGVATSSYQVEGAWNQSGKGENIWDRYLHTDPSKVSDYTNGDVAADSYNKWREDVEILKQLGVTSYRFSISWARILPTGLKNSLNPAGVLYYQQLINELVKNNIEPLVTLYHWDHPQFLEELGGFTNENFPDWFEDYARICFELFGRQVKYWFTINEGITFCYQQLLGTKLAAPGRNASGFYEYQCSRIALLAHAKAYRLYDRQYRWWQRGNVGMVIPTHWFQPASNSTEDIAAADRLLQFVFGWWANPLFNGDYPQIMKDNIARRSKSEGLSRSRLPKFTPKEINLIKGTIDILGVNIYTAAVVTTYNTTNLGLVYDSESTYYSLPEWPDSGIGGKVAPWSIRELTKWIKNTYGNIPMIITETGYGSFNKTINDVQRTIYIKTYLSNLLEGMIEDGTDVRGFTYWSFLDAFEWLSGYNMTFGMVSVDMNSTDRTRTVRDSGRCYAKIATTRCLVECEY